MSRKDPILAAKGDTNTGGYDADLTEKLDQLFSIGRGRFEQSLSPDAGLFNPNPEFNVTDESHISKDQEVLQGGFTDAINSFKRGVDMTQMSFYKGKIEINALGGDGPSAIIDSYKDDIALLDKQLRYGTIKPQEYAQKKSELDNGVMEAQKQMAEYQGKVEANQLEIMNEPVSKEYLWKQAMVQSQGDQGGVLDKLMYSAPNVMGSSAALMGPTLAATFGSNITKALLKSSMAYALGPEAGVPANVIATVGAVGISLAELAYGRYNETVSEVGGNIENSRIQLTNEYMKAHGTKSSDEIPKGMTQEEFDEDMRQLRIKSRSGAETMFWENMALTIPDVAAALIMPLGTLGSTASKLTRFTESIENGLEAAKNYNKLTRLMNPVVRLGVNAMGEKFEEGFQYAADKRAEDTVLGRGEYQNEGLLRSILTDAYDVAASLNYSLIPGLDARGTGKYSQDKEFQFSENSGGMLGIIMGGLPTAISIYKDLATYKAANKDLQDNGRLDIDGKLKRLQNSIMMKYFDNGDIHHLGEAIKSMVGKKDEFGNPLMTQEDANLLIKDMKSTYDIYKAIGEKVDSIGGNALKTAVKSIAGALNFRPDLDDAATSKAKKMVKEDFLSDITNLKAKREENISLVEQVQVQYNKDKELFEQSSGVLDVRQQIKLKEEALEAMSKRIDILTSTGKNIWGKSSSTLKSRIKELKSKYNEEARNLNDLTDEENDLSYKELWALHYDEASPSLQSLFDKQVANDLFIDEYKENLKELNKIKTKDELQAYANKNAARQPEQPQNTQQSTTQQNTTQQPPVVPPQPQSNPVVSTLTDEEKAQQKEFDDIFNTPDLLQNKASKLEKLMRDSYDVEVGELSFPDFYNGIASFFTNNPQFLKDNFKAILDTYSTIVPGTPQYRLNSDMSLSQLGASTADELDIDLSIPPTQADDIDLNYELLNDYVESVQQPKGTGDKITSGLALAQKNIMSTSDKDGDMTDMKEEGKLLFSYQHDQQLGNTDVIKTGDTLELAITNIPANFNFEDKSDENYDKVEIGAYKDVEISSGITKKMLVFHLHRIDALDRLLSDTFNDKYPVDIEAEKELLRVNRRTIIEAGEKASFKVPILSKGFGKLNKNDKSVMTTLANAFGSDSRIVITYSDKNGDPVTVFDETLATKGGMIPGATLALIPNETDNGQVFVPVYLNKKQLKEDKDILDIVEKAVNDFLTQGTNKSINAADPYIFITNKAEHKINVGLKGIYASNKDGIIEVWANNKIFTPDNKEGIREALQETYFTVNEKYIKEEWYQDTLKKSPLLQTNITANKVLLDRHKNAYKFLKDNQQYSYFSQHTITVGSILRGNTDVVTNNVTETTEDDFLSEFAGLSFDELDIPEPPKGKLAKLTAKLGSPIVKFFDDISTGAKKRLLVSPEIPASMQHEMVKSIAYNLVTAERPEDTDVDFIKNTDRVRAFVRGEFNRLSDNIKALEAKGIAEEKLTVPKIVVNNYRLMDENFDAILAKAVELIDKLGYRYDENTDYWENLEERGEENSFMQFEDEFSSTYNAKDFLPKEVKKLLYFIPALRPININDAGDKAYVDAIVKSGQPAPTYRTVKNALNLDTFNNFNDTWEKTLEITTSKFFDTTNTGFEKMLNTLLDKANAPVVQELAKKLQKAPEQVQNAFFRRTRLQKQVNKSSTYDAKSKVRKGGLGVRKFMRIFDSDKKQGVKAIMSELQQEFLTANTGLLIPKEDEATGLRILTVNQDFAKSLQTTIESVLDDKQTSYIQEGRDRGKKGALLTEVAKKQIYESVRQIGIKISYEAFEDLLKYHRTKTAGSSREESIVREVFVRNILGRLLGTMAKSSKEETEQSEEEPFDDLRANDPFKQEKTTIEAIARQEFKYRQLSQSGSYYFEGKPYYAFTRPNYISDFFTKIKEFQSTGVDNFIRAKIAGDKFASRSIYLSSLLNPRENLELELFYELGSRNKSGNASSKLLKEMNPREHEVTKLAWFQNKGETKSYFMYDTLSDKSTKPVISARKFDITGIKNVGGQFNVRYSDEAIERVYNAHFLNEFDRINLVYEQNRNLDESQRIKGYHSDNAGAYDNIGKEGGMGKYFTTFYFLNKAVLDITNSSLSAQMYNEDGSLRPMNADIKKMVKEEINYHFARIVEKNKKSFQEIGLYDLTATHKDKDTGKTKSQPNLTDIIDHNYFFTGTKDLPSVENRMGLENTQGMKDAYYYGDWSGVPQSTLESIVDFVVADYVYNYIVFSNEMLILTGDPAQAGKPINADKILEKLKDKPLEAKRQVLMANIEATYINLGKRNAAFLASGEGGRFKDTYYNIAIAEDMPIDSEHIDYYVSKFGDAAIKAYQKGDKTDAQELTTVKEFLTNMQAYGMIDEDKYTKALYIYDKEQYDEDLDAGLIKAVRPSVAERFDLFKLVMQPQKPVQRTYNIDDNLSISKQYYVKTSAYPLIPDLVTGVMAEMLKDMKKNKVQRVAFVSGVKQGVAGAKNILNNIKNEDGKVIRQEYNKSFFENNINTLHRNGFRIQLEVPFKEDKDHIREGTQQSKLMFVDIPDNIDLIYNNEPVKAGELKTKYIDYHKQIIDIQRAELFKELGIKEDGFSITFENLQKLSQMLQREGEGKGYSLNSLLGLDLTEEGDFKVPLTFLPNAGQIEPVITAILSNNITRLKMPGKSYVQGSEVMLKTGQIGSDEELKKYNRDIVWTKPEYEGMQKLGYLHKDTQGNIVNAQIIMPFYFVDHSGKKGKMVDIKQFTKEENGKTFLDTSMIDPELLQMNGFRIPFQGLNSGMWFEIVGFLPYTAGDLVIVPAEIAGQMGSDYDVDKLYAYMYNYVFNSKEAAIEKAVEEELIFNGAVMDESGNYSDEDTRTALEKVLANPPKRYAISKVNNPNPTTIEELQNALIDIQKSIYTASDPEIHAAILEPLSFDDMESTINRLGLKSTTEFLGNFDPVYQREVYFSNVTGKLGTAISANANTSHALAQGANLFIKGEGMLFLDEEGNPYSDYIDNGEVTTSDRVEKQKNWRQKFRSMMSRYQAGLSNESIEFYEKEFNTAKQIYSGLVWTDGVKESNAYTEFGNLINEEEEAFKGYKAQQELGDNGAKEAFKSVSKIMNELGNLLEQNGVYKENIERTELRDDNRVNTTYQDTYTYINADDEDENNNVPTNQTAWRLDKIFTFDINPNTGRPYRISNLISQILGISVDNAKEQKLGALGINKLNFNVALSIIRVGFGPDFMAAFINQPILKEYYEKIGETDDIYKVDYTANKRNKVVDDLFQKYTKMYSVSENVQSTEIQEGYKLSQLVTWISQGITAKNAKDQLYILKQFLKFKETADGLQALTSTYNIDAKGLPKNMSETAAKQEQIANLADSAIIGNVPNYRRTTIPGLFLNVPTDAVRIFMATLNPVFAYNSPAYKTVISKILYKVGRNAFTQERMDKIHNNIKEFVYSGFTFEDGKDITEERRKLLLDRPNNESLQTRFLRLKAKYPRNELFQVIKEVGTIYPDNPKLLDLPMVSEEDFVQKVSEYWENAIYSNPDPDVQNFAKDLIKYALFVNPKEYGLTNIIRYMPFRYKEEIGFHQYLRNINEATSEEETLLNFADQFIEHNEDFLSNAKEEHFLSGSLITGPNKTIESFTLPAIIQGEPNIAGALVRETEKGDLYYPEYLVSYNNPEIKKQLYRGLQNPDGSVTYYRTEKKGMEGMSEYSMNKSGERTIVDTQRVGVKAPDTDSTIISTLMGGVSAEPETYTEEESGDYLSANKTADEILTGIININNDIIVNPGTTVADKKYAKLYQYLAQQMQFLGLDNTAIIIDESNPTAATASIGENGNSAIVFNPLRMSGTSRTGLSQELEKQRIIIHELLHILMFDAIRTKRNTKEFQGLMQVWKAYKDNIYKESDKKMDRLPSLPVSVFDAELFTLIKNMYDEQRSEMNNKDFISYMSSLINNSTSLNNLMDVLGARLKTLHEQGKIKSGNFDLLSNKNRADEFKNYIVNDFMKNMKSNTNKYYSYFSLEEFVSEAMTNRETQELLRGMPSLWKQFVSAIKDFLASILGIEQKERTLFDDSMDAIFGLFKLGEKDVSSQSQLSSDELDIQIDELIKQGFIKEKCK